MTDEAALDPVEQAEIEKRDAKAMEEYAKRQQFAQATGGPIDPGVGHMGGAGATGGFQPDIAEQSAPTPGNSSDMPSR